jgi:Arc/MetJ-type ribon-helix-helix transcriptional regulator
MNGKKVTIRLTDIQRAEIDRYIKQEFPKVRNVSAVVRLALDSFLGKEVV